MYIKLAFIITALFLKSYGAHMLLLLWLFSLAWWPIILCLTVCTCTYVVMYNNTLFCCRSFGILVWEVATYGKTPFSKIPVKDIVEMASNGSLKLTT